MRDKASKLWKFISEHDYIPALIVSIICAIALGINSIFGNTPMDVAGHLSDIHSNLSLNTWILGFMVGNIFLLCITSLRKIHVGIKKLLAKSANIELISRNDFRLGDAMKNAKNDFFVSGSGMSSVNYLIGEFQKESRLKAVRLLTIDFSDDTLADIFCAMVGSASKSSDIKDESDSFNMIRNNTEIKQNPRIEIRRIPQIMPIVYVGVDIDNPGKDSYIKVQHYLYSKSGSEALNYIVRPDNPLFDHYKEQIDLLWKKAGEQKSK